MQGRADVTLPPNWGGRYFEPQAAAECGQHALNNLLGEPKFERRHFVAAMRHVVATTREAESEHIERSGNYSHSVLLTVLQHAKPAPWRLHWDRLTEHNYKSELLDRDSVCGALVNQDGDHWIALVKHQGLLWHVNSKGKPRPMDDEEVKATLKRYPTTWAVERPAASGPQGASGLSGAPSASGEPGV